MVDRSNQNGRYFDLVLFDLGHTLIYFDGIWSEVIQEANQELIRKLHQTGYEFDTVQFMDRFDQRMDAYRDERDVEWIEYSTALVLQETFAELGYANAPIEQMQSAIDAFHVVTQRHWKIEADTYPTLDLLETQGYSLGIISNASDAKDVQDLIDQHGLRKYFKHVLVSAAEGIRKPHPEIFKRSLDHWNVSPECTVMIGDTLDADILGAQQTGIASVWITRRADRPENHVHRDTIQADAAIQTLAELPDLLARWKDRS